MRLALLSDQHGNDVAFRAALADVERLGVEEVVCLGDVVQGGSEPAQTLDRLATLGCQTVLGNADAFLLEVRSDDPEPVTDVADEETIKVAERIQAALIGQDCTPYEARRRIRLMPPFDQLSGFWQEA